MKKLFLTLVSLAVFFLFVQTILAIAPLPPDINSPNFLGQDQYYSVTFRGNGEAVVNLKIILSNLQEGPLSTVYLRVPKVDPKDISVYQIVREPTCIRYKTYDYSQSSTGLDRAEMMPPLCEEYGEQNYFNYYYGSNKYQKAKYELKGDTIIVQLPNEIKSNSSGSFVVYYRALGYAKKNLIGKYNFVFETLKVEDKIRDLQVGINTDSDLILRGAKGKVNYRFEEGVTAMKSSESMMVAAPIKNSQFDSYYQQIGQGNITKKASNLQPLDSYTVKGSYADSSFKLYFKEILIILIVIIIIVSLLVLLIKFLLKRINKNKIDETKALKTFDFVGSLTCLGVSFISSIFISAYTVFIFFLLFAVNNYLYMSGVALIITVFLVIISAAVYGLLLVAPGIYFGVKKGVGWGMGIFALTFFWLVLYIVLIFIIASFGQGTNYSTPTIPLINQIEQSSSEIKKSK